MVETYVFAYSLTEAKIWLKFNENPPKHKRYRVDKKSKVQTCDLKFWPWASMLSWILHILSQNVTFHHYFFFFFGGGGGGNPSKGDGDMPEGMKVKAQSKNCDLQLWPWPWMNMVEL